MKDSLITTFIPELGDQKKGKVRGVYSHQNNLILIASDRVSAFDVILDDPIVDKGKILTQLSLFWFEKTKDIIENHLIFSPDPNIMVVKMCRVIPIEVVVRKYVTGSLWRDYKAGKKEKCGLKLPKDLKENQELEHPIITPATKGERDTDISKDEIINKKIVSKELFSKIEQTALALFKRGQAILDKCEIILVDTKYEFGLDEENKLVLIDEIHTPDSSRFWFKEDVEKKNYAHHSKEFLREYLLKSEFNAHAKKHLLPREVKEEIRARYLKVYQAITKEKLKPESLSPKERILERLINAKLIKGHFILVYVDESDQSDADEIITSILNDYKIPHKIIKGPFNKQALETTVIKYNQSIEPMVYIFSSTKNVTPFKEIEKHCQWPFVLSRPFDNTNDDLDVFLSDSKSAAMIAIRKLKNICEVK